MKRGSAQQRAYERQRLEKERHEVRLAAARERQAVGPSRLEAAFNLPVNDDRIPVALDGAGYGGAATPDWKHYDGYPTHHTQKHLLHVNRVANQEARRGPRGKEAWMALKRPIGCISIKEFSQILGVGVDALGGAITTGKLTVTRPGTDDGARYVDLDQATAYVQAARYSAANQQRILSAVAHRIDAYHLSNG